ncbi:MAG: hypothetical protein ACLFN8_03010 [Candidatus Woesearchaeota archaeon]
MKQKIDWMLGMTDNMMNITTKHQEKEMMEDMYSLTSAMMGNFHQMKMMMNTTTHKMTDNMIHMMEQMMRSMEDIMMNMNMEDMQNKKMMKHMMHYMVMMQMSMISMSMMHTNN